MVILVSQNYSQKIEFYPFEQENSPWSLHGPKDAETENPNRTLTLTLTHRHKHTKQPTKEDRFKQNEPLV